MSAPIVYKSSDGGAPPLQVSVSDGSRGLIQVLDKCLVTGYGSKAGAGWTIAYTATNKRAYRQGAAPHFYMRCEENANPDFPNLRIRGYATMSNIDTGTGRFPSTTQDSGSNFCFHYSSFGAAGAENIIPWVVIADNK